MRIRLCLIVALGALAVVLTASAASLPELFEKVKLRAAAGDWTGGLDAIQELEAEAARPENEPARGPLAPAAAFYRGVCLAGLGEREAAKSEFLVYIAANPNKTIDRATYPKKIVAVFEEARKVSQKAVGVGGSSSLAAAYRRASAPPHESAPPGPRWPQGAAKYLLTSEESRAFARMASDSERTEFVTRFWLARDPTPETPENEFRAEFERRVAFADEHLADGTSPGSLTDRGMVFVLLGPPSGVLRRPISSAEDAPPILGGRLPTPRAPTGLSPADLSNWKEIWRYRREALPPDLPYAQVDFAFVTRLDYKNVLERDTPSAKALDAARPKPRPM